MTGRLPRPAFACFVIALTCTADRLRAADPPGADVFVPTKVWQIHLTIPTKEYDGMQPSGGGFPGFPGFPGGPGGPPRPAANPGGPPVDVHRGGSFGIEFPWARGVLITDGRTYRDVGLRYKGGGSYLASMGRLRRNIKVDLDRHDPGQRFHGLKTLNLNAGAADPTRVREAVAYAVFRAAGVPAPRTAFAELTLTVPGKYDKELVGTYTLVEQVDKSFLKGHFKSGDGLLLKPEVRPGAPRGPLTFAGDGWGPQYNDALKPKREPTTAEARRVVEFVRLIDRAGDEEFRRDVGEYVDLDQFLRFVAATALVANTDSFFTGGHNAYIYLDPGTNKFVFIPWDLDLSFGGFFMFGPPDQQADLSLTHPYPGEHKLVDRLLAMKEIGERYRAILRELAKTAFAKDRVLKDIDAAERAIREPLAGEKKAAEARMEPAGGFNFGPPPDLRRFVEKRTESVAAQLAGKSDGTIPAMGFGPGGFGGRPALPGEILSPAQQDALRLTPAQRRRLADLQKDADAQLRDILTDDQKAQLKRMRESAPGGRPGGPPGPGRP